MSTHAHPNGSNDCDTLPLEDRTIRAAGEAMVAHEFASGLFHVYAEDGSEYTVDVETESCSCDDFFYRSPDGGCKHIRRVRLAAGRVRLPDAGNYRIDPVLRKKLDASEVEG